MSLAMSIVLLPRIKPLCQSCQSILYDDILSRVTVSQEKDVESNLTSAAESAVSIELWEKKIRIAKGFCTVLFKEEGFCESLQHMLDTD